MDHPATAPSFPLNAWYVACTPADLQGDKPLGRRICGQPMAFFRGPDGQVAALEDYCPHRGAPLSLGQVCKGALVCGYHGLEMGADGRTVAMPGQRVRGFPPIRRYPALEAAGHVWVWPGEAALADPALLPPMPWASEPGWAYGGGLYHVKADYRLMIDNLMDLTHEKYVHQGSIGQAELDEVPATTALVDGVVTTARDMQGVQAPPFWRDNLRAAGLDGDAPVDRWQRCRYLPPSAVFIDVGVALAGAGGPQAPAAQRVNAVVVDFITPETETTMWYFWGMARQFRPEDEALTDRIRAAQATVFAEDLEMLERQQANLSHWPDRRLLNLNTDAGGVQARKHLDRLIEAERAAAAASAQPVAA